MDYCWSWCIFFEEKDVIGALALILTDGNTSSDFQFLVQCNLFWAIFNIGWYIVIFFLKWIIKDWFKFCYNGNMQKKRRSMNKWKFNSVLRIWKVLQMYIWGAFKIVEDIISSLLASKLRMYPKTKFELMWWRKQAFIFLVLRSCCYGVI